MPQSSLLHQDYRAMISWSRFLSLYLHHMYKIIGMKSLELIWHAMQNDRYIFFLSMRMRMCVCVLCTHLLRIFIDILIRWLWICVPFWNLQLQRICSKFYSREKFYIFIKPLHWKATWKTKINLIATKLKRTNVPSPSIHKISLLLLCMNIQ